jgi:hypothetical protein
MDNTITREQKLKEYRKKYYELKKEKLKEYRKKYYYKNINKEITKGKERYKQKNPTSKTYEFEIIIDGKIHTFKTRKEIIDLITKKEIV